MYVHKWFSSETSPRRKDDGFQLKRFSFVATTISRGYRSDDIGTSYQETRDHPLLLMWWFVFCWVFSEISPRSPFVIFRPLFVRPDGCGFQISALREWMAQLGLRETVKVGNAGKWKTATQASRVPSADSTFFIAVLRHCAEYIEYNLSLIHI